MELLIGGDFCPENRAEKQLIAGHGILDDEYRDVWSSVDYRILNLEGPITRSSKKISKVGRHISFDPKIVNGIRNMNIDFFSLANNHVMDYGLQGFSDTLDSLDSIGVGYLGCSANKYIVLEKHHIRVAVLSFTNNEFSVNEDFAGIGPYGMDLIDMVKTLVDARINSQYAIVILHTGLFKYPYPSPRQREICKFLIDNGASAVLCQHSHTIGGVEHYNNGFISYGQGSFVFDLIRKNSIWNWGYVLKFRFDRTGMNAEIIPHIQFDDTLGVRNLSFKEQEHFEGKLVEFRDVLDHPDRFRSEWENFLAKHEKYYFNQFFLPQSRILKKILNHFDFVKILSTSLKLTLLNNFRNEEHREVMVEILKKYIRE